MTIKQVMEIKDVKRLLQENFKKLATDATHVFEVNLSKDQLWEKYLVSFPKGTNEMYRERLEYDCNSCRQFFRNIGNIVFIKNNVVTTIWDLEIGDDAFQAVFKALDAFVKSHAVSDVFVGESAKIGTDRNFEQLENDHINEWHHFYLELPTKFVNKTSKSIATIQNDYRTVRNVFKRSLDELTENSLLTVLELISQNSLVRGEEWKAPLNQFLAFKREYDLLNSESEKENYAWEQSVKIGAVIGKIRNHSIGTLLVNISEEMDLEEAVRKYEKIVAGENYKRPNPIFTKRMLDAGQKFLEENGYVPSLPRRHATLSDIRVNNILFSNKDAAKRIAGADIFAQMANDIAVSPKKFERVEEITIKDFLENVLPSAREIEVMPENKHAGNFVSLTAPENKDAKSMFKWTNGFGWAYAGNMTDSAMKQQVKAAGGNVDGILRFSIQWNDVEGVHDRNDLDAHCYEPVAPGQRQPFEIYYGNKTHLSPTGGVLDVDIQHPIKGTPAVENITWANTDKMRKGTYTFFVENYANRGGRKGFRAEIEIEGTIYSFDYNQELRNKEQIVVAEVTFDGVGFTIKEKLPSNVSTREVWGVKTNQFVPVSVIMHSPNHWDEEQGIGHKHYMFMLKDCVNPEKPNGFYNEFLKEEFMDHKRVVAAIGNKMAVKTVDDQLSGLGFSSTKRNDLIVKVKGATERTLKVKF